MVSRLISSVVAQWRRKVPVTYRACKIMLRGHRNPGRRRPRFRPAAKDPRGRPLPLPPLARLQHRQCYGLIRYRRACCPKFLQRRGRARPDQSRSRLISTCSIGAHWFGSISATAGLYSTLSPALLSPIQRCLFPVARAVRPQLFSKNFKVMISGEREAMPADEPLLNRNVVVDL